MGKVIVTAILQSIVILLQLFLGNLLSFGLAYNLGVGNGWELLVFWLGSSAGVLLMGLFSLALHSRLNWQELRGRLISTLVGSAIGVGLLLLQAQLSPPPLGFGAVLLPLLGALVGFYLPDIRRLLANPRSRATSS